MLAFILEFAMSERMVEFKSDTAVEEQRIVWAEVYAPMIPDSDGEYMDAESIRKMAYQFMEQMKLDQIDKQHTNELSTGAHVVESFIARKGDPVFIEGAWVVGVHIPDDEDWDKVKKGEINGFSIEAFVKKTQMDVTVEIPPVIQGTTMKAEDGHTHKFYVAYNEDGAFLGGRTDVVEGHSHVIKRGTVTEQANDHSHRFSHVDDLVITEKG